MNDTKKPRAMRRRQRGQAMVEYSMINWVLVVALVIGASVRIDWGDKQQKNVFDLFFEAYQIYYDSYFFVLNLPFP
jgi:Flp pilus assembly pilin Flp